MKQTAVDWLVEQMIYQMDIRIENTTIGCELFEQAKQMEMQQLKDAYEHGRDDENCALSDGAMCPDYDNVEEWYQGEYGGEK